MAKRAGTLRAEWERIQGRYRKAWDAEDAYVVRLRVRYGSWQPSTRARARLDRLRAATLREMRRAVLWLEANSQWDLCVGVSCRYIATALTADVVLSATAPLLPADAAAYGSPAVPFYARRRGED